MIRNRAMCLILFWGTIILLMGDDVSDLVYKKVAIKPGPPHVQGPPNPGVGGGPQRDQLPEDLHPPQDGVGTPLSPEV